MDEKNLAITKTARYFTLGGISEKTSRIWIVCHGYGQLAGEFVRHFEVLDNEKNFIVAPEGLHRFYLKGFDGKVGATWMTREDRQNDIKDYVGYLDALYEKIITETKRKKIKITVLGFSQGVATVCRWVSMGKVNPDELVLWAGFFPPDLKFSPDERTFGNARVKVVIGDNDEFLNETTVVECEKLLKTHNVKYDLIRFAGKHEINREVLKKLEEEE